MAQSILEFVSSKERIKPTDLAVQPYPAVAKNYRTPLIVCVVGTDELIQWLVFVLRHFPCGLLRHELEMAFEMKLEKRLPEDWFTQVVYKKDTFLVVDYPEMGTQLVLLQINPMSDDPDFMEAEVEQPYRRIISKDKVPIEKVRPLHVMQDYFEHALMEI